jgi:antitoxin component HigA of HigAB toxin-antitoxin module
MATKTTKSAKANDDYFTLIQRFPLVPIRNARHLKEAHSIIDELTRIPENKLTQGQSEYLEVLGDLTLKFEMPEMANEVQGITGLDLMKHLLEANAMSASDLGRVLGQRELGSKILREDRQISKMQAKALGVHFGLPGEMFLR